MKLSKTEAEKTVAEFFLDIKNKSSRPSQVRSGLSEIQAKEIKKIKSLAMNKKISLKKYRRLFCKKCLIHYSGYEKIRIKQGIKSVECKSCGKINRWKIK